MKKRVAIIDYGVGNLRSLIRAFEYLGTNAFVSENAKEIENSDAIVLPGDGTFKAGMDGLKLRNLIETVKNFANSGKPLLGICLGAQILLSEGLEFGKRNGLAIIPGIVNTFPSATKEKIPHIGWNKLLLPNGGSWRNSILSNVKKGSTVYFIHSYIMEPRKKENILAQTAYGEITFTCLIQKGNVYGCQFHPEKSGKIGLQIINNFISSV